MTAPPFQFFPVKAVQASSGGPQALYPVLDSRGIPIWQQGDRDPVSWEISSMGWCHGPPVNRRDDSGIQGHIYLTSARAVVVSHRFEKGSRYYGIGSDMVVAAAVASKISQVRAKRAAEGTFRVGQMRLPWIMQIVFGTELEHKRDRGEIRLIGQHRTAFGDPESVMLLLRLRKSSETLSFVDALIDRVKRDRYDWKSTTDTERELLDGLPRSGSVSAKGGNLPSLMLAGSFQVSASSGAQGSHSNSCYRQPEPSTDSASGSNSAGR